MSCHFPDFGYYMQSGNLQCVTQQNKTLVFWFKENKVFKIILNPLICRQSPISNEGFFDYCQILVCFFYAD